MARVFLGLGTNIDRERAMRAGLRALRRIDPDLLVSRMYESEAVGFDGAPFYNCVVALHTGLPLAELVMRLKVIEDAHGRQRGPDAQSKGLDIDVLTYDNLVGCYSGIQLPRTDITRYAHVLLPLSEIAPGACLPGTQTTYRTLWARFDKNNLSLGPVAFDFTP